MQKYHGLPSLPEGEDLESPTLAGAESYEWGGIPNLDIFLTRLYRYWAGKGLLAQVLSGALNLLSLAFTVAFSGFLLLGVDWHAVLTAPCVAQDTCDIWSVALIRNPLASRGLFADALILSYLAVFGAYWLWSAMHYVTDVRDMMEAKHWVSNKLGLADSSMGLITWAEMLHKLVILQRTTRLCMARDLNEHDIVSRIMRKDNYLIALVNKGVLRLAPPSVVTVAGMAGAAAARGTALALATALTATADACGPPPSPSNATTTAAAAHTDTLELTHTNGVGANGHQDPDTAPLLAPQTPQTPADGARGRPQVHWAARWVSSVCRYCGASLHGWAQRQGGLGGGAKGGRFNAWLGSRGRSSLFAGRRPLMTKTLEWNLNWCVLDYMFDDKFVVKREFLEQPERLKQRLRFAAVVNAVLSPFLLMFLLLFFFLRNAERFYHHPGSAGSRRWSALARWHLREFNELPHYIAHRLDAAYAPACHYVSQFPSHTIASVARFVAFVAGSFTALFLLLTLLDERLLERPLLGRHLVWWLATLGVVLTASRSFINEEPVAYDPERAMQEVVVHTHYLPRHWRGRAHTPEVLTAFNQLFQFKILLFFEELASVVLTPFMLYVTLPQCVDDIVQFVSDFTVHVEGVGDVCSLASFDLRAHGNPKYGAPTGPGGPVRKAARSKQGKLEKSLLTFMATYPTWEPNPDCKAMLWSLSQQHLHHPLYTNNNLQQTSSPVHGPASPIAQDASWTPVHASYQPAPAVQGMGGAAGLYGMGGAAGMYGMPPHPYLSYLYPQHVPHPFHIPVDPDAAAPAFPMPPAMAAAAAAAAAARGAGGPLDASTSTAATAQSPPAARARGPLGVYSGMNLHSASLTSPRAGLHTPPGTSTHTQAASTGPHTHTVHALQPPTDPFAVGSETARQPSQAMETAPTFDLGSLDEWDTPAQPDALLHDPTQPTQSPHPQGDLSDTQRAGLQGDAEAVGGAQGGAQGVGTQQQGQPGVQGMGYTGLFDQAGAGHTDPGVLRMTAAGWEHNSITGNEPWAFTAGPLYTSIFGTAPPPLFDMPLPVDDDTGLNSNSSVPGGGAGFDGAGAAAAGPLQGEGGSVGYSNGFGTGGDSVRFAGRGGTRSAVFAAPDPTVFLLPTNETHDLTHRLAVGHSVLQDLYEQRDVTCQHRSLSRLGPAALATRGGIAGGVAPTASGLWGRQSSVGFGSRGPSRFAPWASQVGSAGVGVGGSGRVGASFLAAAPRGAPRAAGYAPRASGGLAQQQQQHSGMLHHYGGMPGASGGVAGNRPDNSPGAWDPL